MSTVDVIHKRLEVVMCRVIAGGLEPSPMLAFCRGEVEMGIIQCPRMPEEPKARIEVYERLAKFMSMYGATEAVFVADTVMSRTENPNDDPDATTQLYYVRLPTGDRYLQPYKIEDGVVGFNPMRREGRSEEVVVECLRKGLGWAPGPLMLRQAGPMWLQDKVPGATVGMMAVAVE